MGGLLKLIPNILHIKKEFIDQLPGRLFHVDKKAPKSILMREADSNRVTTQKIPNIISIVIATKLLMNGRYSRVSEPSDDLVILAILVFKSELCIVFILKMDKSLDFTRDIMP